MQVSIETSWLKHPGDTAPVWDNVVLYPPLYPIKTETIWTQGLCGVTRERFVDVWGRLADRRVTTTKHGYNMVSHKCYRFEEFIGVQIENTQKHRTNYFLRKDLA